MSNAEGAMENPVAEDLRLQVELKVGPEDRTIISFEYCYDTSVSKKHREYYTFVAIWIEATGTWYSTGRAGGVPKECAHDDMVKVLASHNVKSAHVVTELTPFKP
jgi:hypothetical protein